MKTKNSNLTRIGIFYDGNYFFHVSNYYNYSHERRSRISIDGLHSFIKHKVSESIGTSERLCQIVDAHYFKGRLKAMEASKKENSLFYERVFDDILSSEGVTTHYLPVRNLDGIWQEKGIDVWLALEAFELAFYKRFDVLVLIASDGDYIPLVRKLNTLGTQVMILSWDFEYINSEGGKNYTRTSQQLLEEATYPIAMQEIIDNRVSKNDPIINNLFLPQKEKLKNSKPHETQLHELQGTIIRMKEGYGFIKNNQHPENIFFHHSDIADGEFNDFTENDNVYFELSKNKEGKNIAKNIRK